MADASSHFERQQAVCAVRMTMHSMRPGVGLQVPVLIFCGIAAVCPHVCGHSFDL